MQKFQPSPPPSAPLEVESITDYLTRDHEELQLQLNDVVRLVDAGEMERAARNFDLFQRGLNRHLRVEEDVAFPAFEAASGIVTGPTVVMRREHLLIRGAVEVMRRALDAHDGPRFRAAHAAMSRVLPGHLEKEERMLYPSIDRALSTVERTALLARMKGLP